MRNILLQVKKTGIITEINGECVIHACHFVFQVIGSTYFIGNIHREYTPEMYIGNIYWKYI